MSIPPRQRRAPPGRRLAYNYGMAAVDYFTEVQASPGWARVLESFLRFAGPPAGGRTLDVGCGPGALVRLCAAAGCDAHGVDADPAMVARAAALSPGRPIRLGQAQALPYPSAHFQLVTATNVLFLLPDPAAGLGEMTRVCAPGGAVAVLNPSPALSRAAAQAHAEAVGLTGFAAASFVNWGAVAENHHRLGEAELRRLFVAAGLGPPEIVPKIGAGLAFLARARRPETA